MPKPIIPKNVPWEESKRLKTILNLPNFMFSFRKFFKFLLITTKNVPLASNSNVYKGEEFFFFSFTSIIFSSLTKWKFSCLPVRSHAQTKKKTESVAQRCCKKGALRNFTKFTRKQLCQSLFFNKAAACCIFPFKLNKQIDERARKLMIW